MALCGSFFSGGCGSAATKTLGRSSIARRARIVFLRLNKLRCRNNKANRSHVPHPEGAFMRCLACFIVTASILFAGCNTTPNSSSGPKPADDQQPKQVFEEFQKAFEQRQSDRMWALLDTSTQSAAERLAEANRTAYATEAAAERTERAKKLGLSAGEIAKLTGAGYLDSKPFRTKYRDVPEYKVVKSAVDGDKARIDLLADDGDKATFELVRSGGAWKFQLPMPTE